MKKYSTLIILGLSIIVTIQTMGQSIILNNDTIPVEKDSLFLTIPSDYRGISTWQQSTDGKEWHSLKSTTGDSLFVETFFGSYYRAKIEEGTCNDVYTDIVEIAASDSVVSSFSDSIIEYAYPDSAGTLVDVQFGNDTVICRLVNGEYIFQGDIILDESQMSELPGLKGAGIFFNKWHKAWPDNKVYYTIRTFAWEGKIQDAIDYWDENTTLNFIDIDDEYNDNYIEFVRSKLSEGNSSKLGMIGGAQEIRINILDENIADRITNNESAIFGIALHEIGHAVGLLHEQSRSDIDKFIIVNEDNIDWDRTNSGDFKLFEYTLNIPNNKFDFQSIMLYNSYANTKNGKPTITKNDLSTFKTQSSYLSKYDILTVKKLYPVKPDISTFEPDNITSSSVTCGGKILDDGGREITDIGLCWSTNYYFTVDNNYVSVKQSANIFSKSIHDLKPNTKYYIKAFATNEKGTSYGRVKQFTTLLAFPEVTTGPKPEITHYSAIITGNFTTDGGSPISVRGVCWNTSGSPDTTNNKTTDGSGVGSWVSELVELQPNTTYYLRAYATNSAGTAYGEEIRFTTPEISSPEIQTLTPSEISHDFVILNANVLSDGGAAIEERGFYLCEGDSAPDNNDRVETVEGTTGNYSKKITGLKPSTTYSYRAFASNSEGTSVSVYNLFATDAIPQVNAPEITTPNNFAVFNRNNTTSINIQWSSVNNADEYWLNVFPSGQPALPVFNESVGSVTNKEVSISSLQNGVYIVQVKSAASGGEWSDYSQAIEFIADTPPGAPVLSAPGNEAEITQNTQQSFNWDAPSTDINRYYIRIVNGTDFNGTPVYDDELTTTSQSIDCDWPAGTYTWSVRAIKNTPEGYAPTEYENAIGWGAYATTQEFIIKAEATLPSVTTANVTSITQTTASSGGDITSDGGANVTARGVCWNTAGSPDTTNNKTTDGSGTGSWVSELTELQPNTTYYVRAYATNSAGTAYGEEISFPTAKTSSPEIQTLTPSEISHDFVILNANVSSDGGAAIVERGFYLCEGDSAPDNNDRVETVEGTTGNYSKKITGLKSSTTYSYRAFASNSEGTAVSVFNLFATDAIPQVNAPEITTPNNFAVFNRNNTTSINIQWSSVNNADEYWLNVFPSGQPASPVFNESVGSVTNKELSISSLQNGVYIVQVKAAASGGEWSDYSQAIEFIADTPPDAPVLSATGDADEITQNTEQSFNWDAPSADINRYYIRIVNGTDFNGTPVYDDELTTTSQSIDCNWSAGTYTWSVRAIKNTPEGYAPTEYENAIGWGAYATTQEFIIKAEATLPSVTTANVTSITQTTASSGGDITSDGGATVTARGVCWNTIGNPDITDNKTIDGSGTGSWTSELSELQPNTSYYVRAYATNSQGTAYGEQKEFTTLEETVTDWPRDTETEVVDVINPATGKTWMDRNLGASRAATSSTDEQAYGDLYQWGRAADGHQKRNSNTTSTLSTTDTPGHGDFILASNYPYDWRSPQNDNLWQGVSGINNPCPSGYRLPSIAELHGERNSWTSNDAAGALASPLKLTRAGYRLKDSGSLNYLGFGGLYWSDNASQILIFLSSMANEESNSRAIGASVRCIKNIETQVSTPVIMSTDVIGITRNTATIRDNVTSNGGATISSRGVCWNTSGNPDLNDNKTVNSAGIGTLDSYIEELQTNAKYYVRSYATNNQGTAYGEQIEFTTHSESVPDWPRDTETEVVDVTNPATGKIWMDRNLGASRAADSITDIQAYGDLYQWGRPADGHQKRNSSTTSVLSTSDIPGHGNFIRTENWSSNDSPIQDWRSPQNNDFWQGVSGVNNPCPQGYRLPTKAEWEGVINTWDNNVLKLPMNGIRYNHGGIGFEGSGGSYWSSTISGTRVFLLESQRPGISEMPRSTGCAVRCIKD